MVSSKILCKVGAHFMLCTRLLTQPGANKIKQGINLSLEVEKEKADITSASHYRPG